MYAITVTTWGQTHTRYTSDLYAAHAMRSAAMLALPISGSGARVETFETDGTVGVVCTYTDARSGQPIHSTQHTHYGNHPCVKCGA